MKKQQNNSTRVWALVVAFSIALLSVPVVLIASSFTSTPATRGLSAPINGVAAGDKDGNVNTVRYEQIRAMLLSEFLKEHRRVEAQRTEIENQEAAITELKSTVAQQQKGMEVLTTQLKEQAAQIQKVSAKVEMTKPASQLVANKP
jgi:uncharacterized coiled-coil protein SlyX